MMALASRGTTLVELLVGMGLTSLTLYLLVGAFLPGVRGFGRVNQRTELLQRGTLALNEMTDSARAAFPESLTILRTMPSGDSSSVRGIAFVRLRQTAPYDPDTQSPQWETNHTVYCLSGEGKLSKQLVPIVPSGGTGDRVPRMGEAALLGICEQERASGRLLTKDVRSFDARSIPAGSSPGSGMTVRLVLEHSESRLLARGPVELETTVHFVNTYR